MIKCVYTHMYFSHQVFKFEKCKSFSFITWFCSIFFQLGKVYFWDLQQIKQNVGLGLVLGKIIQAYSFICNSKS